MEKPSNLFTYNFDKWKWKNKLAKSIFKADDYFLLHYSNLPISTTSFKECQRYLRANNLLFVGSESVNL